VLLPLSILPLALFALLLYLQVALGIAFAISAGAILVGLIAATVIVRRITQPIRSLTWAALGMAAGDLAGPRLAGRNDELGELVEAFNRLSDELRGAYENIDGRVEARTRQFATAAEIGRATTSILTAEDLLARAAELIRDRFGFDHVLIFLADESARTVVLTEAAGPAAAEL
jgi:methyl-accepting chemotaxis protein